VLLDVSIAGFGYYIHGFALLDRSFEIENNRRYIFPRFSSIMLVVWRGHNDLGRSLMKTSFVVVVLYLF
jgi:hypothetical protein